MYEFLQKFKDYTLIRTLTFARSQNTKRKRRNVMYQNSDFLSITLPT